MTTRAAHRLRSFFIDEYRTSLCHRDPVPGQASGQPSRAQPSPWTSFIHCAILRIMPTCPSMPSGSLESHCVLWKTLLSLLSWVSIFNLEEKKITALWFGCIKIYGTGWFLGCCHCRVVCWWCMMVTCHQCSPALMMHCSIKSFVIHHCLSSCPHLCSPAGSPGEKQDQCSYRTSLQFMGQKKNRSL